MLLTVYGYSTRPLSRLMSIITSSSPISGTTHSKARSFPKRKESVKLCLMVSLDRQRSNHRTEKLLFVNHENSAYVGST